MSEGGYKSIYSVFIFLLAFSIVNFYATKMKEERRFRMAILKAKELKATEQNKTNFKAKQFWDQAAVCLKTHELECQWTEIFVLNHSWN